MSRLEPMFNGQVRHMHGWHPSRPDPRDKAFRLVPINPNTPPIPATFLDMSQKLVPALGVYDQGDIGCHDEKTEVLTQTGWTPWPEYDGKTLLATINPLTHLMEFQDPIAVQQAEYNGPMHYIDNTSLNFALTPTHRMYSRRWNQKARTLSPTFEFRTIAEIGWYAGLLAAPKGHVGATIRKIQIGSRTYEGNDFIAMVSQVISNGWVGGTESNWNTLSFCCFRDDHIEMVRGLAHRLGIREIPSRPGVWKWSDPELANWFRANAFTRDIYESPFKRVPTIIKTCSTKQIEHFLAFFGDQHVGQTNRQFYSASQQMIDDLQELLLKVGRRSGIYGRDPRSTVMADGRRIKAENCTKDLTLTEWTTDNLAIERKKQIQIEHYKGPIYCATVPNSTLITRRNGKVLISGNSCTANMSMAIFRWLYWKAGITANIPQFSRMYQYDVTRTDEGTPISDDSGASIRDAIAALHLHGACPEALWPYDTSMVFVNPPAACAPAAQQHETMSYHPLYTLEDIKQQLAAWWPVGFGFSVPQSFMGQQVAQTGIALYPQPNEEIVGGHAVLAIGYDDVKGAVLCLNSWGASWGLGGTFYLPYGYFTDGLATDFWCVITAENISPAA